jgi:hypothetical protein
MIELFTISLDQQITHSTYANQIGKPLNGEVQKAVNHVVGHSTRLLYGPYIDAVTEKIGPRTSAFHDDVTLLFIQPVIDQGMVVSLVVGRIPNDVLGDLIQREAGHIYPDSGDNYLFMAKSNMDPSIAPGTALSRSRFEDRTFTFGENLKDGVHTKHWGTVEIQKHTEFEISNTLDQIENSSTLVQTAIQESSGEVDRGVEVVHGVLVSMAKTSDSQPDIIDQMKDIIGNIAVINEQNARTVENVNRSTGKMAGLITEVCLDSEQNSLVVSTLRRAVDKFTLSKWN